MNRMLWISSICLAMAIPALAGARQRSDRTSYALTGATATTSADVCSVDVDSAVAANPEYEWRLRAYRQLDCVIGIVEKALEARNGDVVTLSREDAERVRTSAFRARDAAARIGR
jgi:hypothetical protein